MHGIFFFFFFFFFFFLKKKKKKKKKFFKKKKKKKAGGSGASLVTGAFGDALFAPGQPLDASKFYIILPDAIGSGGSAKPSDGLKMKFPRYNYDDIVAAQYRLLTERLGIKHLRLATGNSMGGMLTWMWGEAHPDFMDALLPLASTPGRDVGPQLDVAADAGSRRLRRSGLESGRLQGRRSRRR